MTRLRELREERARTAPVAFTQAAIASRIGVSVNAYRAWESGHSHPRKRHLRALAREFGIPPEEFSLNPEDVQSRPKTGSAQLKPLAAGIIVRDDRVLMTQRRFPQYGEVWSWPSGKPEPHESLEQALIRELNEELLIREARIVRHVGDIDLPSGFRMTVYHTVIPHDAEIHLNDYEQLVQPQWMTRDEIERALGSLSPEIARQALQLVDQVLASPQPIPSASAEPQRSRAAGRQTESPARRDRSTPGESPHRTR